MTDQANTRNRQSAPGTAERLHYMDNLRAVVMIAGVFFHAALAYSPFLNPIWMSADTVTSPVVDWITQFIHLFRMPVFFVVAGFFTSLLIQRRGTHSMLKNRAMRVLLPFIVFWPPVFIGIGLPMLWAMQNLDNLPPLLQMIKVAIDNPEASESQLSTMHLWFLYYLCFFYILAWLCHRLPLSGLPAAIEKLHPVAALLVLPLALVPGLYLTDLPFPAPESFVPQLWPFGFFGLFFAYGTILYRSTRHIDDLERHWLTLAAVSLLLSIVFIRAMPEQASLSDTSDPPPIARLTMIFCTAYVSVFMSAVCLIGARKLLNRHNRFMRYMSDASYWVYIVHLPIVLAIQYPLLDQPGGLLYKFTLSSTATLAICVLSYALLARWTPIGWLLNGQRRPLLK